MDTHKQTPPIDDHKQEDSLTTHAPSSHLRPSVSPRRIVGVLLSALLLFVLFLYPSSPLHVSRNRHAHKIPLTATTTIDYLKTQTLRTGADIEAAAVAAGIADAVGGPSLPNPTDLNSPSNDAQQQANDKTSAKIHHVSQPLQDSDFHHIKTLTGSTQIQFTINERIVQEGAQQAPQIAGDNQPLPAAQTNGDKVADTSSQVVITTKAPVRKPRSSIKHPTR